MSKREYTKYHTRFDFEDEGSNLVSPMARIKEAGEQAVAKWKPIKDLKGYQYVQDDKFVRGWNPVMMECLFLQRDCANCSIVQSLEMIKGFENGCCVPLAIQITINKGEEMTDRHINKYLGRFDGKEDYSSQQT